MNRGLTVYECPFCGRLDCHVTSGSGDITDEGYRIRERECPNCGRFATVEAAIILHTGEPAPFRALAVNLRAKQKERQRKSKGWKNSKRGFARSAFVRVTTHFQYLAQPDYRPVQCRNGHYLLAEGAWYQDAHRKSICRECKRAADKRYKERKKLERLLNDNSRQTELGPSAFAQGSP